ncbi:uncharacterized protein BX663DRAFT_487337 [Cokeromyces recurvatus]|uniref:uncharacterized protein n=1 Tax=Cokeromyces recurvatus TaxID=90255 RepID=UPI00221EE210|nr:uncharacterized protein BX663DRAFT_487337 [Cokeromyces recurvatus]KAI7901613.1 hypothetical protein BX663DRAFT_487337 [Cokeromyces recurvatus]
MKNLSIPKDMRLGGMDAAYLQLDNPRRSMTITTLWTFKRPLDLNQVYKVLDRLCLDNPRFARVPCHGGFFKTPALTIPIGWYPKDNVVVHHLKEPSDQRALQKYCAKQVGTPFDYNKPLWQFHIIYGLENNGCATFFKVHHSISDGEGLMKTLMTITSWGGDTIKKERPTILHHPMKKSHLHLSFNSTMERKMLLKKTSQYYSVVKMLTYIYMAFLYIYIYSFTFCHDLYQVILILTPYIARKDLYYQELQSHEKEVAWSENIDISDIKIVRQAFGGTLNDVMLTVVTRCIKNYLESIGRRHDNYLKLFIPLSLRDPDDDSLQNRIGGAWGFFSMKDLGTQQLINQVRMETFAIKSSNFPSLLYEGIERSSRTVPGLPPPLCFIRHFCDLAHGAFTNISGPTFPISFAGEEIQEQRIFSPQLGKGTMGIALISYCDKVSIGALADVHRHYPGLAEGICQRFVEEFEFILEEAKLELSKKKSL